MMLATVLIGSVILVLAVLAGSLVEASKSLDRLDDVIKSL